MTAGQRGLIPVNQLDSAGWTQWGLSPRQAASAVRYRRAVGGFRDIEVLQRMRVLPGGVDGAPSSPVRVPSPRDTRPGEGRQNRR